MNRERVRCIVTTEAEAIDALASCRPGGHSSADGVMCEQELFSEAQPLKSMVITISVGRR